MNQILPANSRRLYAVAGHGLDSMSVILIEKKDKGCFLYRIDILDQSIMSEAWHHSMQEAADQAWAEAAPLSWKMIPEETKDSIPYIFEYEPRLLLVRTKKPGQDFLPLVLKLIWADFAITSLISIVEYFSKGTQIFSGLSGIMPVDSISPVAVMGLFVLLGLIFTVVVIAKIPEGSKMARNAYAFTCLTNLVPALFHPGEVLSSFWTIGILIILQFCIEIYCLFLLYGRSCKELFEGRSSR